MVADKNPNAMWFHLPELPVFALLVWSCEWILRWLSGDPTAKSDLVIVLLYEAWTIFTSWKGSPDGLDPASRVLLSHLALIAIAWIAHNTTPRGIKDHQSGFSETLEQEDSGGMRPLIFECKTTHTRLQPVRHSFAYSYLLVGIPVAWKGCANSLLSANGSPKKGWFSVDAADYLLRDASRQHLSVKLEEYLAFERIDTSRFKHAYLVTAPRVLDYSFNPVSFWYLYSEQKQLVAMVLEVNNTFDERRMYYLEKISNDDNTLNGQQVDKNITFKAVFSKDFHVSPFMSRDGSYRLAVKDVMPFGDGDSSIVSNNIELISSEGQPKLVARIFSTHRAIDPEKMSLSSKLLLIVRCGFIGFLTFSRILIEAWKLYFHHKIDVLFRPEVKASSIGRRPTQDERTIEQHFRGYLKSCVQTANVPLTVTYQPAPGMGPATTFDQGLDLTNRNGPGIVGGKPNATSIRVLSPAFYSRMIHYAHDGEVFDREFAATDERNRTVMVKNAETLVDLFPASRLQRRQRDGQRTDNDKPMGCQPLGAGGGSVGGGQGTIQTARVKSIELMRWRLMRALRCAPPAQSYGSQGVPPIPTAAELSASSPEDIRALPFSPLDQFVMETVGSGWRYRRLLTKHFLAQRLAAGTVAIIDTADWIARMMLVAGSFRTATVRGSSASVDAGSLVSMTLAVSTLHMYALAKGF